MNGEGSPSSNSEQGISIPLTDRRMLRRKFIRGLVAIVERGERLAYNVKLNDKLMLTTADYLDMVPKDKAAKINIVTSILFAVYESNADLNDNDIVNKVNADTEIDNFSIDPVFDWLFEKQYIQLSNKNTIVFGTPGYWLLENAFMNGEEEVDSMAIVERNLEEAGFFRHLS